MKTDTKRNNQLTEVKSLSWHKIQAMKSEDFSSKIAEELGLTVEDLRLLGKQKVTLGSNPNYLHCKKGSEHEEA